MSNISLVALLVLTSTRINPAATISCYKCHATDAEKCKETQKQTPCDSAKREDTCITVLYKDKFHRNGRYVQQTYIAKSCAPRNYSCPWMCTSLESTGHTGCKGTCCHDNLCNYNVEEKVIFYDYFKNGSGIHDKRDWVIAAFVLVVFVIFNHWFTS